MQLSGEIRTGISKANKICLKENKNILEKMKHYKNTIFFSKGCTNREELRDIIEFNEGQLPFRVPRGALVSCLPKAKAFLFTH